MSDELYLSQDMIEWLGQKKSELLAWLIDHRPDDDIPIDRYPTFETELQETILHPDSHYRYDWQDQKLSVFVKSIQRNWFVLISVELPEKNDTVYYPLLFIPTRQLQWVESWFKGDVVKQTLVH